MKKLIKKIFYKGLLATLILSSPFTHAGVGDIDLSFGVDGFVVDSELGVDLSAEGLRALSNGKILQWGRDDSTGDAVAILKRYNQDGSVDESFGSGGLMRVDDFVDLSGKQTSIYDVGVLSDGSYILAVCESGVYDGVYLIHIGATGEAVSSFDTDGIAFYDYFVGDPEYFSNLAIDEDDNVIMAFSWITSAPAFRLVVAKINGDSGIKHDGTSGTDDFGGVGQGYALEDFPAESADISGLSATDMKLDEETGAIFILGDITVLGEAESFLAKRNSDGSSDSTFGGVGYIIYDAVSGANDFSSALDLYDGKLIATGMRDDGFAITNIGYVFRVEGDGNFDTSFGTNGRMTFDFGVGSFQPTDAIVDDNGNTYVLTECPAPDSVCVVRITPDGIVDEDLFGSEGTGVVNFMTVVGVDESPAQIDITSRGRLIVNGSRASADEEMVLAQYLLE